MRFEFDVEAQNANSLSLKLHESNVYACVATSPFNSSRPQCSGCGSYGLKGNDVTGVVPCVIMVDVNGDRKPTPGNVNCTDYNCAKGDNIYKVPLPSEKKSEIYFQF